MGLSLAKVSSGGERYYLRAVAAGWEDSRPPGLEPDGSWVGRAVHDLGLRGEVAAPELRAVMAGADPATGEILSGRRSHGRVAGFDLTFSAPKSASVVFALGSPSTAAEVAAGHASAVLAAVDYLEREALQARRTLDGRRVVVEVEGAVGAGFPHRTSRALDPHLHTHVLVANLVRDLDGAWSAFDARPLYLQARTAGFLYEAHMRAELSARLGVAWEPVRNGRADIEGIAAPVLREFSQRQSEVDAYLAARGEMGPEAEREAVAATRAPKDLGVGVADLRERWAERARSLGYGQERISDAIARSKETPGIANERLVEGALTRVASGEVPFSRRDLLRACCEELRQGGPVESVERLADDVMSTRAIQAVELRPGHRGRSDTMRLRDGSTVPAGVEGRCFELTLEVLANELDRVERAIGTSDGMTDPSTAASSAAGRRRDLEGARGRLSEAVKRRADALERRAVGSPPKYLVGELGPYPETAHERRVWREAARCAESYRDRWGIGGAESVPGPGARAGTGKDVLDLDRSFDVLREAGRYRVAQVLERAALDLGHEREQGRLLAHGREADLAPGRFGEGRHLGRELDLGTGFDRS